MFKQKLVFLGLAAWGLVLAFTPFAGAEFLKHDSQTHVYEQILKIGASSGTRVGQDPVNRALTDCLSAHSDTAGSAECYDTAYRSYREMLEKAYALAENAVDEGTRDSLRASQEKWESFHKAELKVYQSRWIRKQGTGIGASVSRYSIDMVRERISEMSLYLAPIQ